MIPINVTHRVIFTRERHLQLLDPGAKAANFQEKLPQAITPLRQTLSSILLFFAETYKSTFGFADGPPLHDALTIAYIVDRELFTCKRYRVDVELSGTHTSGATVVDIWNNRGCDDNSWGPTGKNCLVAENVDVSVQCRFISFSFSYP
jgi:uridine nucleosidase